jgi:hypothetical protein
MSKIARTIGVYTFTLAEDGILTVEAAHLQYPLTFAASQVQELQDWLAQQKVSSSGSTLTEAFHEAVVPSESSEDVVGRVIAEAIALTRESYPAGLELENRDRFIDQITRDPLMKPLIAQGKISRKQIMLEIEQRLSSSSPSPWSQDKGRRTR